MTLTVRNRRPPGWGATGPALRGEDFDTGHREEEFQALLWAHGGMPAARVLIVGGKPQAVYVGPDGRPWRERRP